MNELSFQPRGERPGNALVVWQLPDTAASDAIPHVRGSRLSRAPWNRTIRVAKTALMIWGGISLTAVSGYAVGEALSGPGGLKAAVEARAQPLAASAELMATAAKPAPAKTPEANSAKPPQSRSMAQRPAPAASGAAQPPRTAAVPAPRKARTPDTQAVRAEPLTNADDVGGASVGAPPDRGIGFPGQMAEESPLAGEERVARLPRPRPDDPVVTGSIDERWDEVRRPHRWDRRFGTWREREFRRFQRLPRYIIVR